MRAFIHVWVWFAFSILGFTFLPKTEIFAVTQNSQSNFLITQSSETGDSRSSSHMVGLTHNGIFQKDNIDFTGTKILALSQIATYTPEYYRETSSFYKVPHRSYLQAIKDKNGSKSVASLEGSFGDSTINLLKIDFQIERAEIISQNVIRLTFSEYPDPATVILPDRYSISGYPPYKVELLDNMYQLDIHFSYNLSIGEKVDLFISTIKSEEGVIKTDIYFSMIYTDGISDIFAVDNNTIYLSHHSDYSVESFDPLELAILEGNFTIQILDSSTSEVLKLRVRPELEDGLQYQLLIPSRKDMDGKNIAGSIRSFTLDHTPPKPVHVSKAGQNKLLITFDEPIDPVMAVVPHHYTINGSSPIEVILTDKPNQLVLVMEEDLNKEEYYELSITNLEDSQGNAILIPVQLSFNLKTGNEPDYKSIVINEVMAAPRAGLVLPNSEYVELLNLSNKEINISGYRLHNSRSGTAIPAGTTILPGEYLLLCPNARRGLFEPFGKVVGLTNWPTLLNNADIVMLLDREGFVIDSLGYTRSHYGSTQIAQGGYSLEVVNPHLQCYLSSNLRPSLSPARGTPGNVNSVFDDTPDRSPPSLKDVSAVKATEIVAVFSKPISKDFSNVNWTLSPEVGIVSAEFVNGSQTEILLGLDGSLSPKIRYTLQVTNIRDCSGNLILPDASSFVFALPEDAEAGDLIINEILFNPHTGTPKFVEVYNASEKYINLKNWKLGNESGGLISNRRVISGRDLIVGPKSYRAVTTDAAMLTQMYPKAINLIELGTLPSYPIREGTVFLLSPDEEIIERLDYHENFHHPLIRIPRGVSLERIDPYIMSNDPQNWTSAAGAEGSATPGYKNSQLFSNADIFEGITISPEVFAPETIGSQNYTTIQYRLDDPGYIGTIKIFDISGKLIKNIVQNEIWGSNGFYLWNGTDMNGNKVRVGYYIIWIELLNLEGKVINFKKTVVVGTKIR